MKKHIIIWIMALAFFNDLQGQTCLLEICNSDDCGDGFVSFAPSGENVFCEGAAVEFVNTSTPDFFNYFVISWGDGLLDTIYNYDNISHVYNFSEQDRCGKGPRFSFQFCYVGYREGGACTPGFFSCSWQSGALSVKLKPKAFIQALPEVCIDNTIQFLDRSCNGGKNYWDFGDGNTSEESNPIHQYEKPGVYQVRMRVSNECGDDETVQSVSVVTQPQAIFDFEATQNGLCIPSSIDLINLSKTITEDNPSGQFLRTNWSISPSLTPNDSSWCFADTTQNFSTRSIQLILKEKRDYTITLEAFNSCGEDIRVDTITTLDAPILRLDTVQSYCGEVVYTPSVSYENDESIDEYLWQFENGNPSQSNDPFPQDILFNVPGRHEVKLSVKSQCGNRDTSIYITVIEKPKVLIEDFRSTYCKTSDPDTLRANIAGGEWSGTGIINAVVGIFDPSLVNDGQTIIKYSPPDSIPCIEPLEVSIVVSEPPLLTLTGRDVCSDSPPQQLIVNVQGGLWSGKGVDPLSGVFDPQLGEIGENELMYEFETEEGCQLLETLIVRVESLPSYTLPDTSLQCSSAERIDLYTVFFNSNSELTRNKLRWRGEGIDSSGLMAVADIDDDVLVFVDYNSDLCSFTDSVVIKIEELPNLIVSQDTTVCIRSDDLRLSASIPGGKWNGRSIDPTTGTISIRSLNAGAYNYTYIINENTTCSASKSVSLNIVDPNAGLNPGSNISLCSTNDIDSLLFLNAISPANGFWEGGSFVNVDGVIRTANLKRDSIYVVRYCVEAPNVDGCKACKEKTIIINSLPVADFDISSPFCVGDRITIRNRSVNGMRYRWDFGDGIKSVLENPVHSYSSPGNYEITLDVESKDGCKAISIKKMIKISAEPIAAFDFSQNEGCQPFQLQVDNLSTGDSITSFWQIGTEIYSDQTINSVVLSGIGQDSLVPVKLTVRNFCGERSKTDFVLIYPLPESRIGFDIDEGCSPFKPVLSNASFGNPQRYRWDYGQGQTSNDSIPLLLDFYSINDSVTEYNVSLITENSCGSDTAYENILVFPPDVEAFISLDTLSGCPPLSIPISSVSTHGSIINWQWYNDDNLIGTSTSEVPDVILSDPGRYSFILSASRCGTDWDTAMVEVFPSPDASFDLPSDLCVYDTILLRNNSTQVSAYEWSVDDSIFSTAKSPILTASKEGAHTIILITTNDQGCQATNSRDILIRPLPNREINLESLKGCIPLATQGNVIAEPEDNILWYWGDGTSDLNPEAQHIYREDGIYSVRIKITDQYGCIYEDDLEEATVYPIPKTNFRVDKNVYCTRYDTLKVTNTTTGAELYNWTFGGRISQGFDFSVPLTDSGISNLKLVAQSEFGCLDSLTIPVEVINSPVADFRLSDNTICAGMSIDGINLSQFFGSNQWYSGYGTITNGINASFRYTDPGEYEIVLIVNDERKICPSDTVKSIVVVSPNPDNFFELALLDSCQANTEANILNQTKDVISTLWMVNEQEVSNEYQPVINLNEGNNIVKLVSENIFECKDTLEKLITVYDTPGSAINNLDDAYCRGDMLLLSNSGKGISLWSLVDFGIFNEEMIEVLLDKSGSFQIELAGSNGTYCRDTVRATINVYETPVTNFEYIADIDDYILGDVQFINTSERYTDLSWDFGDKNSSVEEDPLHTYDINPPITVRLSAINTNGGVIECTDNITKEIQSEYLTTFYAPNAMAPEGGVGDSKYFKPVGLGIAEYNLTIYSPWGEAIWSTNQVEDGSPVEHWDGNSSDGNPLPQGVYLWKADVIYINGFEKTYSGDLHLIR